MILLLMGTGFPVTLTYAQAVGGATMSVCELLKRPSQHNGKVVSVRGVYSSGNEGLYLRGENCQTVLETKGVRWPYAIWIELAREEFQRRELDYAHLSKTEEEISAAIFRARFAHGFDKNVARVRITYTGLFETRASFDDQIGKPSDQLPVEPGFGHLNGAPGQLFVDHVTDIVVDLK